MIIDVDVDSQNTTYFSAFCLSYLELHMAMAQSSSVIIATCYVLTLEWYRDSKVGRQRR